MTAPGRLNHLISLYQNVDAIAIYTVLRTLDLTTEDREALEFILKTRGLSPLLDIEGLPRATY